MNENATLADLVYEIADQQEAFAATLRPTFRKLLIEETERLMHGGSGFYDLDLLRRAAEGDVASQQRFARMCVQGHYPKPASLPGLP
jgi:hypothetical protein